MITEASLVVLLIVFIFITQDDIQSTFETIVQSKAVTNAKVFVPKKKKDKVDRAKSKRDEENYISYQAKDFHTEAG